MAAIMRTLAATILLLVSAASSWAQTYPSKPISLIVGFAPGGPADANARATAEALGKELGQPVIVDNKAGATGVVGLEQLQRSAPDGYTIGLFISSTAIAHVAQKRKFELAKQMLPLGSLITSPVILCVNPDMVDVKDLDQLLVWLRKHPDAPYATSGSGSPANLNAEALARKRDLKINHIAYRGIAPALVDVLGGRVGILFSTPAPVRPYIESGKLRPIAVLARKRVSFIPDVATAAEQGYHDLNVEAYSGLVVPFGTPSVIVEKLRDALQAILRDPAFRAKFESAGDIPEFINGPEWGEIVQSMHDHTAKIVSELGLRVE